MPETNGDAFRRLEAHGVLDHSLGEVMPAAVGFCNILVHRYGEVDDDRVKTQLGDVEDLEQFTGQIADWVVEQRTRPGPR